MDLHLSAARSVDQDIFHFVAVLFKGRIQAEIIFLRQRPQNGVGEASRIVAGLPAHHRDGSLVDAPALVRNHQIHVKFHLIAQAVALRTGAEGIVEGKAPGFDLIDADPAVRAGEALAEGHGLPADHIHEKQALRERQHAFNGIRKPSVDSGLHHQAVHHDLDIVLDIFIQLNLFRQLIQAAVHAHPHVAAALRPLQHLGVFALPSTDHRGQELDPGSFRQRQDLIHHLIHGLFFDLLAALRAVGDADAGIEQTEIIIDLRHRPHRGTGIAVGGFLVDGNGRRQPLDLLHIGLFHLSQELPRVGGQGFHISPLPFRVDRVKGERRLSRAGQAGEDHQLVPGNIHAQIFQIVFIGPSDFDVLTGPHFYAFLFHDSLFPAAAGGIYS